MKRMRKEAQETKDSLQIGTNLTIEERLKIIANLIIDRIIENQKQRVTNIEKS